MSNEFERPIIIKRKKVSGGDGHHGGAWKVAYADFVTAMMAFFMLMWLLNATTEKQRKGLADYFSPEIPIARVSGGGDGSMGGSSAFSQETLARDGVGGIGREPGTVQPALGTAGTEKALEEARESAEAAAAAPAAAAPVAATPTPTPTSPAPRPATGGIPWVPIGGGLLVLALGTVLLLRRRAQSDDGEAAAATAGDDVFAGVSLKKEALSDAEPAEAAAAAQAALAEAASEAEVAGEKAIDEVLDRGGSRGYGERKHDDYIDEAAGGDALAEADIYIAYGRYMQAIELLDEAIKSDPGNGAYRVKLIELYVDMGEEQSAAEQLEELRKVGDADAIARGELLLGSGGAPKGPAPAARDEATLDLDDDLAEELDLKPAPALDTAPVEDAAPEMDQLLDEEFETEKASTEEPLSLEPEDPSGLSLQDAGTTDAMDQALLDDADDVGVIEFEHLEIEEEGAEHVPGEDDLDLSEEGDDVLDLSDALEEPAAGGDERAPNGDLMIADDADQMATKLDLARAYLDMGDSDGARGILEEVAGNGTGEQKQEAEELLSRIG